MKKPNKFQLETLVSIFINLGSILLGSVAIPVVFDRDVNLMIPFIGIEGTLKIKK